MEMSRQFSGPQGSEEDKAALIKQLSASFHMRDLEWIEDPDIAVRRTAVSPHQIDFRDRNEWEATHEPGKVRQKRRDIKKGELKPVAVVNRPHDDNGLMVMDGHHHTEAYTQLIGSDKEPKSLKRLGDRFPAFEISVPRNHGPWDELHSKQEHNKNA